MEGIKSTVKRLNWQFYVLLIGFLAIILSVTLALAGCERESAASQAQPSAGIETIKESLRQQDLLVTEVEAQIYEYMRLGRRALRRNPEASLAQTYIAGRAIYMNADRYGLSPDLVAAIIDVESEGNPEAESSKGALGLMQVMPVQGRKFLCGPDLKDPETNIECGTRILAGNIKRWGRTDGIERYNKGNRPLGNQRRFYARVAASLMEK